MSSNWGIKTDDGYVNFIHGTIDKVWDFETSSSIDDIVIFSERAAKGYAKAIKANAIQISISEQPQLTIPKNIAEMLDFIYDNHFDFNDDVSWVIANIDFLPTDEDYYSFNKWINQSVDNHNLALAYLAGKALGVELVKVVADE